MQTLKVYPTRVPISTSVESSPKGDLEQTLENFKRSILFENRRRTKKNQGQNDGLNFSAERLSAYYIPRVGKIPKKAPNLINKLRNNKRWRKVKGATIDEDGQILQITYRRRT